MRLVRPSALIPLTFIGLALALGLDPTANAQTTIIYVNGDTANTARTSIAEAIKAGKSFIEAATAAGLAATEVPAYTKDKPPADIPNQGVITEAAAELNPGEISTPREVPEGLLLVATLKRELPKDPKMDEDKKAMAKELTEGGEGGFLPTYSPLFEAWFKAHRKETSSRLTPEA